eukprot:2555887-Pleurochrysis_carterae.AAC.1
MEKQRLPLETDPTQTALLIFCTDWRARLNTEPRARRPGPEYVSAGTYAGTRAPPFQILAVALCNPIEQLRPARHLRGGLPKGRAPAAACARRGLRSACSQKPTAAAQPSPQPAKQHKRPASRVHCTV